METTATTPPQRSLSERLFWFLCSIRFTVVLLVTLAVILAVATVIESKEGTGAVQMKVYRAFWFNVFLAGFTLNLMGGTYKRMRRLWVYFGFAVTHLGVFTILLGAFLTRNFGIEGQMTIPESATREYFVGNDDLLTVSSDNGADRASLFVPIDRGSKARDVWAAGKLSKSGINVVIDKYYSDLSFDQAVEPGGDAVNPGIEVKVKAMQADMSTWLLPRVTGRDRMDLGPLVLRSVEAPLPGITPETGENKGLNVLVISEPDGKNAVEIVAKPGKSAAVQLGGKSYTVSVKQAFLNFQMNGNDFGDAGGGPENPAVAFTVEGPDGKQPDMAFAKYPEFSLLAGKKTAFYKAKYLFRGDGAAETPMITIHWLGNGKLGYAIQSGLKVVEQGQLTIGKPLPISGKHLEITALRAEEKTRLVQKAINGSEEARNPAIHVKLVPPTGEGAGVWLPWGEQREVELNGRKLSLLYRGERYEVPFSIKLIKFKEDKYPGTMQSATYESKVFLSDAEKGRSEELVISMNEPLLYRGYTFFQSSYIPGETYTTVLSVSRDPGKWPTYIGYILMTVGIILMFYCKSFLARWDQANLKKKKETK